jgi:hypothetical protein
MESQTGEQQSALSESVERMAVRMEAAASLFEHAVALVEERAASMSGEVQKIVAAVETRQETRQETSREQELVLKLTAAEQQIAELQAQIATRVEPSVAAEAKPGRKTIPATTAQLLAKQGLDTLDNVEAGALDAALSGLSLEQRIAVKAQLLRAGLAG